MGYLVREAQVSPALQSLSAALELVTGREAKAQAAYETSQAKLALAQDGILAQEEEHRSSWPLSVTTAYGLSCLFAPPWSRVNKRSQKQRPYQSRASVVIPEGPETTKEDYLAELDTAAAWEHLAIIRQERYRRAKENSGPATGHQHGLES